MFYTQESDGKWQWPWAMPTAQQPVRVTTSEVSSGKITFRKSLAEAVAGKISSAYIKYLMQQGLYTSGCEWNGMCMP